MLLERFGLLVYTGNIELPEHWDWNTLLDIVQRGEHGKRTSKTNYDPFTVLTTEQNTFSRDNWQLVKLLNNTNTVLHNNRNTIETPQNGWREKTKRIARVSHWCVVLICISGFVHWQESNGIEFLHRIYFCSLRLLRQRSNQQNQQNFIK